MSSKEFLIIVIATFITVVGWVVFDIIHKRAAVEIPANIQEIITPVEPNFDLEGIE